MGDEPLVNYLSCHPLFGSDPQPGAEGLKALSADQRRRTEVDIKVAQVEPDVRRRILRDEFGTWIMAIIVFGFIIPMVFGGIDFGDRANAIIAMFIIVAFGCWIWRARRKARTCPTGKKLR